MVFRIKIHFIFPRMFMRLTFIVVLSLLPGSLLAQNTDPEFSIGDRFISSAGLSFPRANHNHRDEQFYGLCYSPTLNLLNKHSDFSVAMASHLSLTNHFKTVNDPVNYLMLSLPAFLQFNIGHLAKIGRAHV